MAVYDIDLEKKIESNHELRKINECIDFSSVAYRVNSGKSEVGRHGYGLDCGLKCLFLQFMVDHSDREMEKQLRYTMAYQWFCGFSAFEQTPDHSFLADFGNRLEPSNWLKYFK